MVISCSGQVEETEAKTDDVDETSREDEID